MPESSSEVVRVFRNKLRGAYRRQVRDFIVGQRGRRMIVKTIAASQVELNAEVVV